MRRSNFEVVLATLDAVVIRDLNRGASVTNDAENVVADLLRKGTIKPGMRLHHYDTDGKLDELEFDENGFTGFCFDPPAPNVAALLTAKGLSLLVMLVPWAVLFLGGGR